MAKEVWFATDVGVVRKGAPNEDTYLIEHLTDGALLAAVCDGMGGAKESDKLVRRLEREIEKQEKVVAELDVAIEAAAADYQELTRLLGEKEDAEMVLLELMEQWEAAQE